MDRIVVSAAGELIGCVECAAERGLTETVLSLAEWEARDAVCDALASFGLDGARFGKPPQTAMEQPRAHVWEVTADDRRFFLKRYHPWLAPEAIRYEQSILAHLAQRLPVVAAPLPTRDGASLLESASGRWGLYPARRGHQATAQDIRFRAAAVGEQLGGIHVALEGYVPDGAPHPAWDACTLDRLDDVLGQWPPLPGVPPDLVSQVRDRLAIRYFGQAYGALPRTIVHGDYALSNLLWSGDQLTGIIDFERAHVDSALCDFGRGLWSHPTVIRILVYGYSRVRPLSEPECDAFPDALLLGLLLAIDAQLTVYRDPDEVARLAAELVDLQRNLDAIRRVLNQ